VTEIVVLKFGGTSVATRARWETIAQIVQERVAAGLLPIVVCSAVAGISNALEKVLKEVATGDQAGTLAEIRARHIQLGEDLDVDAAALVGEMLDRLERLCLGASLVGEVSPRTHARVLASGELMSTTLGAAFLNGLGLDTGWVDARACLSSAVRPGEGDVLRHVSATCDDEADSALRERLLGMNRRALLTQGFIARDQDGDTVLLGRGGSDTSAAYFSARVGAARCEIWTDVPGMYSANPRQIPSARLLRALGYDEAQEIASTGAKVLHPRCLPPVRRHGIPLEVRCVDRPDMPGTVVSADPPHTAAMVKAISVKTGVTLVSMNTTGMWQQVGFLSDVFAVFGAHGLSVDLVSTSEMNVTVSLDPAANVLDELGPLVDDLSRHCSAEIIGKCAAVSLVGRRIRAILHKLGPALEVFEEHHIHLVSQAASDLNLTFVVDEEQADRLAVRLHALLFDHLEPDEQLGPTWRETFEPAPARAADSPWWHARREELLELGRCTPRYVYDIPTITQRARSLTSMANVQRVFYAMKANSNRGVLRALHDEGVGFECVSPGELNLVRELFPDLGGDRILFTPNFAARSEYEHACEVGAMVTLDNIHPLRAWPDAFRGQSVLVRVDPGQGRGHHEHVRTAGARSKFGVAPGELEELAALAEAVGARVVGLHAHAGSGVLAPGAWAATGLFLGAIAERFPHVRSLDVGGGLGVPTRPGGPGLDLVAVDQALGNVRRVYPNLEIWMEPGRFLVAEAGVLITRVNQLKRKGDILYVGVDTGMNSLIRPALYGAWHEIVNLSRFEEPTNTIATVVGPICESGDTLGRARRLPPTREGDILLLATAGAYGHAMSSRYNLREPAAEALLR
jgi:bifunctional diaminopimelate decarboxylase / aspartate kinase